MMNDVYKFENVILSGMKNFSLKETSSRFFTLFGVTGVNKLPAGSAGLCYLVTLQLNKTNVFLDKTPENAGTLTGESLTYYQYGNIR